MDFLAGSGIVEKGRRSDDDSVIQIYSLYIWTRRVSRPWGYVDNFTETRKCAYMRALIKSFDCIYGLNDSYLSFCYCGENPERIPTYPHFPQRLIDLERLSAHPPYMVVYVSTFVSHFRTFFPFSPQFSTVIHSFYPLIHSFQKK